MTSDEREDYLINILRLAGEHGTVKTTELAKFMEVTPASVTGMLKVLYRDGLVDYQRYQGVSLTDAGLQKAKDLRRKHHIMERFLTNVLDMDPESAHNEAHAIEHSLSDSAANKICRMTGTKIDTDCTTCDDPCTNMVQISDCVCAADMSPGQGGEISHLSSGDSSVVRRLISMGFVPGREISIASIVSDKGARIITIGETTIALDREMAAAINVNARA